MAYRPMVAGGAGGLKVAQTGIGPSKPCGVGERGRRTTYTNLPTSRVHWTRRIEMGPRACRAGRGKGEVMTGTGPFGEEPRLRPGGNWTYRKKIGRAHV